MRERIADVARDWMALLRENVAEAQRLGGLDRGVESEQLAFELDALLALGNSLILLEGEEALERARRGVADLLAREAVASAA